MDSKIIVINTAKGGSGKTTITTNLASYFATSNPDKKVCLIDLDEQGGVSTIFGRNPKKYQGYSILSLILGERKLNEIVFNDFKNESKESIENFYFIPAEKKLSSFNETLLNNPQMTSNFIATMKFLKENFDYIFIDTHPDTSKLNLLAYYCADLIVVPVELDMQNKFAIDDVMESTRNLQNSINSKFYILPNKVKANTKLHKDFLEYLNMLVLEQKQLYPNTTFLSQFNIPNTTQYSSIPARKHIPLVLSKSKSKTMTLHKEIIENISKEILEILE